MLNERIIMIDGEKPVELMNAEEKDENYLSRFGMNYEEFNDLYKNDTPELLLNEFRNFIRNSSMISKETNSP